MYINISLKYHSFTGTQSRIIAKVHDLLGQPSYYSKMTETDLKSSASSNFLPLHCRTLANTYTALHSFTCICNLVQAYKQCYTLYRHE